MILGIDHVGIAVLEASAAARTFATLTGGAPTQVDEVPGQAVRVCFVPAAATGARLELLEPAGVESPVARFLDRRGEGVHHVCFAVDDVGADLARLTRAGFVAVDAVPRPGHGGLVAFLHPKSAHGVLIELLQRTEAP
jgi:methylmalonyl-CoA/ethylmalonyl-CoA epimerase